MLIYKKSQVSKHRLRWKVYGDNVEKIVRGYNISSDFKMVKDDNKQSVRNLFLFDYLLIFSSEIS